MESKYVNAVKDFCQQHPDWQLMEVTDALGSTQLVMSTKRILDWEHNGAVLASETPKLKWNNDEDDDCSDDENALKIVQHSSLVQKVTVTYFIMWDEAYRIPSLYAEIRELTPSSGRMLMPVEVQTLFPQLNCCCSLPVEPTEINTDPVKGYLFSHSFCELLNRALYHLHPCDPQELLQLVGEVAPQSRQSVVEQFLLLIGPSLRF